MSYQSEKQISFKGVSFKNLTYALTNKNDILHRLSQGTQSMYATSNNPAVFTVPKDGYYAFGIDNNGTQNLIGMALYTYVNSSIVDTLYRDHPYINGAVNGPYAYVMSPYFYFEKGEQLALSGYGSLTCNLHVYSFT